MKPKSRFKFWLKLSSNPNLDLRTVIKRSFVVKYYITKTSKLSIQFSVITIDFDWRTLSSRRQPLTVHYWTKALLGRRFQPAIPRCKGGLEYRICINFPSRSSVIFSFSRHVMNKVWIYSVFRLVIYYLNTFYVSKDHAMNSRSQASIKM